MKNNKICIKCGREIFDKEDYFRIEEYIKGKLHRVQIFHKICFEDMFNIKRLALGMAAKANKLMEMAGIQLT